MIARIIAIGDELLLGRTRDGNSVHLARQLSDLGFQVAGIEVVADDQQAIIACLGRAQRARLVLVTGGLGPTEDDRTRHALAQALAQPLEENAQAWRMILAHFARIRPGGVVAASNRRQALFPRGSEILANASGTAPGILARLGSSKHPRYIACMPGVPHEMEAMFAQLRKRLPRLLPGLRLPVITDIHLCGIGESSVQERIAGLFTLARPRVGITVSERGHLTLRVVGGAAAVRKRAAQLRARLRAFLLPEAGVAASLVAHLRASRSTLSVAESCTCGRVCAQLGVVPGLSQVLGETLVAYQPQVKTKRLGVSAAMLRRHGIVSEEVAGQMARGMRARSGSDVAIATTGVAGPGSADQQPPVGTVCLAVAVAHGTSVQTVHLAGSRERIQDRAAAQALVLAWQVVSGAWPK